MKKPFKKAIAVLLAVLMVAFSVPFTALAAVGDYEPDVELQFSPYYDTTTGSWNDYTCANGTAFDTSYSMLYDAPLTYDSKNGTITLEAAKTEGIAGILDIDPATEDYQYGVGDFFAVTVVMDNIDTMWVSQQWLKYSDNIEPAGLYYYTKNRVRHNLIMSVTDGEAAGYTLAEGGTKAIGNMSCENWYTGLNDGILGNLSLIDTTNRIIKSSVVNQNGTDTVACATTEDENFINPITGEAGYTYDGRMICNTFIFAVTGDGPITFEMADPQDTYGAYNAGYYIAYKSEGVTNDKYTTYAPCFDEGHTTGTVENAGSCKMTFFGENVHRKTPSTEYTVTFKYADGSVASEATYAENTAAADVAVPANTAATADDENHYTYAWPAVADVTADATYEEVKTTTAHAWDAGTVTEPATCGKDGVMTYTCTVGGETRTEAIPATGNHTWDDGVVTKEPTETETGIKTYTCTVCGATKEEVLPVKTHEHVWDSGVVTPATCTEKGYTTYTCACGETRVDNYTDALGHEPGEAVVTETKAATCTEPGSKNTTVKCTRCGEVISSVDEEIPELGHEPGEPVVTETKPATCTEPGSKNTTVKCTRCGEVISSVDEEIPALDHAWVKGETVAPTIREDGYTVYTCSRCGETEKRNIVPALGINVTVNAADLGEVTGLATGVNNVAYGTEYTLTATALDGAKFDGWEINGKIVSTNATYTSAAVNDVTINPLFSEVGQDTITVKFADSYGNVFATFTGTADEVAAKIAANEPVAPVLDGYTFSGWSQDITSFTDSVTVVAQYEAAETGYTVTTSGTLTLPDGVTNGAIPYDTAVTVFAEGATAWAVDGVNVGYGDTYTFFVGSNIEIEPVFDAVTAVPTVNIVSAKQISGSHKVSFLATRNIPDGYTLVNAGFVYGKNLSDADLDLDNVGKNGTAADAGVVKVAYASKTGADQFALNYGITSQTGKATAKAFIVVKKGATTSVIYSDYDNGVFTY